MIQTQQRANITEIYVTEGYLHKKGSEDYSLIKRRILLPSESVEDYEEVDELPKYTRQEYEEKVSELIRERYSLNEELAILRQRDVKQEKYAEYNAYAEECKERAKEILNTENNEENTYLAQTE